MSHFGGRNFSDGSGLNIIAGLSDFMSAISAALVCVGRDISIELFLRRLDFEAVPRRANFGKTVPPGSLGAGSPLFCGLFLRPWLDGNV